MYSSRRFVASATALALCGLAACADSTGIGGARSVSLSFSTVSMSPVPAAGARFALAGTTDALVITKAQLVFSRTELERAGIACTDTRERGDDSCPEIHLGPMLVELPLDGSARTELTVTVPAGTYHEFEADIDAIRSESEGRRSDAAAFLAANPQFRGVSIRVEGTYDGTPFIYTTDVEAELELEFEPALTIDGAATNLTVRVDVPSWFRNGTTSIDPSTANAGGANKRLVDANIQRSFRVFEDDDRNGRDN
jgi:hypothetical protein